MVAGIKGVAFLDDDTLVVSSSTAGELFLVSRDKREVLKKIPLGDGVKAESLACVPKTRKVLVVDAKGHLCEVDCETIRLSAPRPQDTIKHRRASRASAPGTQKRASWLGQNEAKRRSARAGASTSRPTKSTRRPCWRLT